MTDYKECCNWHGGECWITGEPCAIQAGKECKFYEKYVHGAPLMPLKGPRRPPGRLSRRFHSIGPPEENRPLEVALP